MPRKPKETDPGQLSFEDNPDDLPPLPPARGTKRLPHKDGFVDVPEAHSGVSNSVESYARNLLLASFLLDSAAPRRGLAKAVKRVPGKREELDAHYKAKMGGDPLDFVILRGAEEKKEEGQKTAGELFDDAFGDFELAKQKALEQFTPEERAEIELSPDFEERQETRQRFLRKMQDSRKDPNSKAQPQNKPTLGLKNRRELQKRMRGHLQRLQEQSDAEPPVQL